MSDDKKEDFDFAEYGSADIQEIESASVYAPLNYSGETASEV